MACLGLDTFGMSTGYIAGYVHQAEKLLEWLEDIRKVAEALTALTGGGRREARRMTRKACKGGLYRCVLAGLRAAAVLWGLPLLSFWEVEAR